MEKGFRIIINKDGSITIDAIGDWGTEDHAVLLEGILAQLKGMGVELDNVNIVYKEVHGQQQATQARHMNRA